MKPMNFKLIDTAKIVAAALLFSHAIAQKEITFSGGSAISYGRIAHSSDKSSLDYSKNFLRSISAQFLMSAAFGDNLKINAGLGALERHFLPGGATDATGRSPFVVSPYLVQANFAYSWWDTDQAKLKLTGGYFPYTYNPDVKNLGLYLLRGPVYPGILISGFETKHIAPVANMLGLRVQHVSGIFEQNLVLTSETELYPLFDFSPAYIANVKLGGALKIGAGVNFFHWIPIEKKLTSPDTLAYDGSDTPSGFVGDPNLRTWVYVDTIAKDTTYLSFKGTKVMANASLDPKVFFGSGAMGANDLKLYAEVALIGLDMSDSYKAIYGGYMNRMPVMVGFNLPMFNILDNLSIEAEWYGSKVKDDLSRYQASTSNQMSPLPVVNRANLDLSRDDWKWSLHGSKKLGQVRVAFQVANDHSRPGGKLNFPANEWQSFFISPKDWYAMSKVAFFF